MLTDAFRTQDWADAQALIDDVGLATLATSTPDGLGLEATPLPMCLSADGTALLGHIARANPLAALLAAGPRPAVACFLGPHAYVSPSFYPSKADAGRAVPTWNYLAVQVHGAVTLVSDPAELRALLARLTERHEAGRPHPWTLEDAPADYLASMMRAIIGVRLSIARWEGKRKLSQNRTPVDHAGVIAGLSATPDGGAQAVAAAMRSGDGQRPPPTTAP